MSENITRIKLKFSCGENWDAMHPVENGGRRCDQCHKVVYDFTNSKADEFRKILAENNYNVCGRFTSEQMATKPFPFWKRWVSAAIILIGFNLVGDKAWAQKPTKKHKSSKAANKPVEITFAGVVMAAPPIPGYVEGEQELHAFFKSHLQYGTDTIKGQVIIQFTIEQNSTLTDIKVVKSLTPEADTEVLRVLKLIPQAKWAPGMDKNHDPVPYTYTVTINYGN